MAHLYRLIVIGTCALVSCLVALLPLRAIASSCTEPGGYSDNQEYSTNTGAGPWYPDWATPCAQVKPSYALAVVEGWPQYSNLYHCQYTVPSPPYAPGTIHSVQIYRRPQVSPPPVYCPEPTEQELLCESLNGTSSYGSAPGRTGPGASTCTATGCAGTFAGTVLVITDKQGVTRTEGDITFNGSVCTYDPNAGAVAKPCQGQEGQVNGVTVCVPYSGDTNVIESVSNDSSSTDDSDNTKDKSESTQKSTKCEGNKCTTTTTTTYNYNGTTGTRSETKTESKDDFCSKNPAATQCKGGSFAGSCSGGFTCDGDAVQCAIAREQHKRACSLFDATSPERTLYEESKGATGNQAPTVPGVAITSSSFDTSNALGAAACLVDVPVTIANHQLTVPFSKVCPHLDMLKAVLISVSLLLAGRIVSRG